MPVYVPTHHSRVIESSSIARTLAICGNSSLNSSRPNATKLPSWTWSHESQALFHSWLLNADIVLYSRYQYNFCYLVAGASVIISPSHDCTTNASTLTFNCSGNGASLLWTVDGHALGSSYVLNKGIQYTPTIVLPDKLTVSSQLIVPTTKANNITVICTLLVQSNNPVKLYLQGAAYIICMHVFLWWTAYSFYSWWILAWPVSGRHVNHSVFWPPMFRH